MNNFEFDIVTCLDRVRCMKEILREMPYMNRISRTQWQEMNCKLLEWEQILQDQLRVEV